MKKFFVCCFLLLLALNMSINGQYYIKVERSFSYGECSENKNWFNSIKTVIQLLKKNDIVSCYEEGNDPGRNTQEYPLLYHNKACPEILNWNNFVFDWVDLHEGRSDIQDGYSDVQTIDDQIDRIGIRNQGAGDRVDIDNFNEYNSYNLYTFWYFWMIENIDPYSKVVNANYQYYHYSGGLGNYFHCSYYPNVSLKITVDDPVFVTLKSKPSTTSANLILQYTPFYDNKLGNPVLECSTNGTDGWKEVPSVTFNSAGGTITLNYPDYNFTSVYFRVRKTLDDGKGTLGYGNTLALDFSTLPTINTPSPTVTCNGSPVKITGAYSDIESSQFKCFLEARLSSGTDDDWAPIKNTTFKVLPTGSSLNFSDITSDNSWLGKEILLRPYYYDYFGNKIIQETFKSVVFLPKPNMTFSSTSPKCHGNDDGSFTIKFKDVPEGGCSDGNSGTIPLLITVIKYGLLATAPSSGIYNQIDTLNQTFYYQNGVTVKHNLTGNSVTIDNAWLNDPNVKLTAGIYEVSALYNTGNQCPASCRFVVTEPSSLVTSASAVTTTVGNKNYTIKTGETTDNINLSFSGGTPPYYYKVGTEEPVVVNTQSATISKDSGIYNIKLYDSNNCPGSDATVTLSAPDDISIGNILISDVSCNSNNAGSHNNGLIEFSVSGGVSPYTAKLYKSSDTNTAIKTISDIASGTSPTFDTLEAGNYVIKVTDALNSNYNKTSNTITVGQPSTPLSATLSMGEIPCPGGSATITITGATGGTPSYKYSLDGTSYGVSNSFTGKTAGQYIGYIQDSNGCKAQTDQTSLNDPTPLSASLSMETIACYGGSATITISGATGGKSPYTYSLDETNYGSSNSFTGQKAGQYIGYIKDQNECTLKTSPKDLNAPLQLSGSLSMGTIACYGGSTTITIKDATGGTPPYTYSLDGNSYGDSYSFTGQIAKQYIGYIKDKNECTWNTTPQELNAPTQISGSLSMGTIACHGGSTTITITGASGGTPSYTYSLDGINYGSNNNFTGKIAGNYTGYIKDKNECIAQTVSSQLGEPLTSLTATLNQTQSIKCKGDSGTLKVSADGGGGTYTCYLSTGETPSNSDISLQLGTFSKPAGAYTAYVKDNNDCVATSSSITLTEPSQLLTISTSGLKNSICGQANGGATLTITGGEPNSNNKYNLKLSGPTAKSISEQTLVTTYTDLLPGDYTVEVSDQRGCTKSAGFTISNTGFSASASYVNTISGFNMHSCDETGKLNLTFQNGTPPYSIKRNDTNEDIATVNEATTATIECPQGEYKLSITDNKGCSTTASDNGNNFIFKKPILSLNSVTRHSPSCHSLNEGTHNDGFITYGVNVSSGYNNYSVSLKTNNVSPVNNTFSGLTTGNYTVVLAETGCNSQEYPVTIADPELLTASITVSDSIACKGGSTSLSINADGGAGSYYYSIDKNYINNTTNTFTEVAGTYTGYVIDQKNCIASSLPRKITESDNLLSVQVVSTEKTSCNGAADGSVSFGLSGGTPQYHILIKNSSDVTVKDDYTSNATFKAGGLLPGSYTAAISDFRGCSQSIGFDITAKTYRITNVSAQPTICNTKNTGQISCSVENGLGNYNFSLYKYDGTAYSQLTTQQTDISEAGASFTNLYNGKYRIISTDKQGCNANFSDIDITTQKQDIILSATVSELVFCKGSPSGTVALTRTNGDVSTDGLFDYSIRFNGSAYKTISEASASWSLHDLADGKYSILVTDDLGCQGSADVTLDTLAVPLSLETPTSEPAACATSPSGKMTVSPLAGTRGATDVVYHLNTGVQSATGVFTGLIPANNYTVYATYGSTCATKKTDAIAVIASSTSPVSFSISPVNQSCTQVKNGKIAVLASSKFGAETYTINKIRLSSEAFKDSVMNSGQTTFANLKEQSYYITVFDQYQCSLSQVQQITNLNNNPKADNLTFDSTACDRANNGAIHLTVNQPVDKSPFSYYLYSSGKTWTTGDITGLRNGKDTVRVTDSEGCPSVIPFNLPNTLLPVKLKTPLLTDASCEEASNGTITLKAENGIPGYKFFIPGRDTVSGNNVVFKDFSAHYSAKAKVFDKFYCADSSLFTIPVLPLSEQLSLTLKSVINAACPGIASGKAVFDRKNGLAGYWYSITGNDPVRNELIRDNSPAPVFDGYAKGHYSVSVTDTVHCKATADFTVSEPENIYITDADSVRIKEFGKPQGKISATVQGGNHKYQYRWMSISGAGETELESGTTGLLTAPASFERSGLYAGRYSLEVRDTAQCNGGAWLRQTFTITQPDQALNMIVKITPVTCNGRSDGKTELSAFGGWKGYQYSFNGTYWRSSGDTTGLVAGTYTAYVKDLEDIVYSKQFEVTQPEVLSASLASQNNAQCFGYSDGSASLTINGGNFPYYLALSPTAGSWAKGNVYSGLAQGSHTIFVKDSLGCSTSVNVAITQPDQILVSDTLITQSRCLKDNGAITVQVIGGIPDYTYRWYNNTSSSLSVLPEAAGLYSGTYKLEVKDSRQCSNTFTFILSDITDLTIDNILTQPALCLYDTTGKASITISKGNPPYSITWPDNSHDTKVAGLKARENYIVSVADVVGCKVSQTFTIGNLQNLPHPNIASFDSVACTMAPNGAARLQVGQVIPKTPYNYYLINNKDTVLKGQSGAAFTYSGLNGYLQNIRVVDSKGCFTDTAFTIPATLRPVSVALSSVSSASCSAASNGKVNVTAANGVAGNNGYTFVLPDRQDTIRGWTAQFLHLPAYYSGVVKVFDRYQCSVVSQSFQVPVIAASDQVKLSLGSVVNASCQGYDNGKASLLRSNGAAPFRYIVTPAAQPQKKDTSFVNGQTVLLGGYPQGQYSVSLLDSANCQASASFIIKDPSSVVIAGTTQKVKAKGKAEGRIDVSVTGGNNKFDYQWLKMTSGNVSQPLQSGTSPLASPVSLTLDKIPAGSYRLLVRDTAQCHYEGADWITRDYTIVEPQDTLSFSASVIPVSCLRRSDGQISIQGSGGWGGYTYSSDSLNWINNGNWQGLPMGNYQLFVKDVEGVVFSKKVPVIQTDSLTISSVSTSPAICNGSKDGSISLQVKGGTSPFYAALLPDTASWPKLAVINGLPQSGTMADSLYTVYVKDSRNCKASVVAHVLQPAPIAVASSSITPSRCLRNNGAIQVAISGGTPAASGYSFLWSNNDTSFNSASASALWAKTYQLKITDSHLCSGQFSFTVPDISDLTIDTVFSTPVLCYGDNTGKASISVSKGNPSYSIIWPDKSTDVNVTGLKSAGNYTVYVSDRLGCHTSKNFSIGSPTQVAIDSYTSSMPLCLGVPDGSLKVYATGGTPGYSYLWNTGKKSNSISGLDQGAYQVTVTDAHNCVQTFGYSLMYQHAIKPSLGPDMTICQGNSYKLTTGPYQGYSWTSDVGTSSSDSCLYASKAGHYYVKVTDNDGCIGYDTVAISVSATELQGKFLVATNVQQNDTVMIFETSWPLPDSVQFVLPGCKVIGSGKYYREVVYPETGIYSIGLTAFLNDCLDKVSKEITVTTRTAKASSKSMAEKLIQRYTLSPNPNNGQFRTEVLLRENADIRLRLANVGTGIINDIRTYKGSGLYTIDYDMSHLASGIYVLYLQAGNEVATKTFIIQK